MSDLISRQVAIDEISHYASIWMEYDDTMSLEEVAEAALKAAKRTMVHILEELPSVQPSFSRSHENDRSAEPCEDAVSRKAVEEMLKNGLPTRGMWEIEGDVVKQTVCETLADALMDLEKLPSVTPKEQLEPCEDAITIDWLTNYMNGMIAGSDRWWGVKWMLEDWAKSRENKNHDT